MIPWRPPALRLCYLVPFRTLLVSAARDQRSVLLVSSALGLCRGGLGLCTLASSLMWVGAVFLTETAGTRVTAPRRLLFGIRSIAELA